ncbi:hypothetical protein DXG03_006926 [Asterophora parasitica]|uniref:Uncharacterized protein n=1 Tax=Asterophora parasitica TaxID=117018 RepID=A0A9P7GDB2_9AGAR|nr:hypothetical protein DXG03_006926 [Asterophora parasitica]
MLQNTSKAKRKVPDDETGSMTTTNNPLLNAAKKAKREVCVLCRHEELQAESLYFDQAKGGASNKRKLLNTEEQPGGLLIIRAPPSSAPPTSTKPPSKKFKSSQPSSNSEPLPKPASRSSSFLPPSTRHDTPDADPALDDAVRAMQDEAAYLRRTSRGPPPTHAANDPSKFRFPATNGVAAPKGKRRETIVDMSAPLPPEGEETPQIQRNKRLRAGAMAALGAGNSNDSLDPTQPHNSVSDASFWKHIDADLPDAERMRQLLIWCAARAAASSPAPKLSAKCAKALKAGEDDLVQKLAERRVDLSMYAEVEQEPEGKKKENSQNVTNRVWEGVYGGHIKSAIEEEDAWKKVGYAYETYARRLRTSLEKRKAAMNLPLEEPSIPSAKAQGKQRALDLEPREQELPQHFQHGMRLARTVIARSRRRPDPQLPESTPGAGPSTRKGADPDLRPLPTAVPEVGADSVELDKEAEREREADAALRARVADVELKLDHLYVLVSQARVVTETGQLALDRRFEALARALDARSDTPPKVGDDDVLGRYVTSGGEDPGPRADEAFQLLRALARVDAARPPGKVGDAARRAVREVQRVGESGAAAVGDRRLTGVPPAGVGVTPRKMPGTPRRGTTPSRR